MMHKRISILAAALVAALAAAAVAMAVAGGGHRVRVVATAKNSTLGKTVLVTTNGMTLYSLSVERKGKFICVGKACLAFWHPLVVKSGVTPTGATGLATVKRPDGRQQVTFRGGPLYTFSGDHARGDAKGDGFKDVGVWHAAAVGSGGGTAPAPAPTTTSSGSGYGGYGY
jgi:predicted lipoprotein with Yx(FWY)xxD motif